MILDLHRQGLSVSAIALQLGLDRWHFTLASVAYNLIRLPKLLGAPS
jgi:hypothetical protein